MVIIRYGDAEIKVVLGKGSYDTADAPQLRHECAWWVNCRQFYVHYVQALRRCDQLQITIATIVAMKTIILVIVI